MSEGRLTAKPDWIAVDWGTSSLRVWAVGDDGSVCAKRSTDEGMSKLAGAGYEDALLRQIADLLPETSTRPVLVIICGMAGAKGGWVEAGYRQVPCAPPGGDGIVPVETRDRRMAVWIVPGLSQSAPADVMRGEETQLAGLVSRIGPKTALACLPGTHSKWVRLEAGEVASFTTFMTGELFAVLATHSILRLSLEDADEDRNAFADAVSEMLERSQDLTAALFSVRAASVLGKPGAGAARSRLSGLLIGAEIAATRPCWQETPVHLIGADQLADSYAAALEMAGAIVIRENAEAMTLAGLAIARTSIREAMS